MLGSFQVRTFYSYSFTLINLIVTDILKVMVHFGLGSSRYALVKAKLDSYPFISKELSEELLICSRSFQESTRYALGHESFALQVYNNAVMIQSIAAHFMKSNLPAQSLPPLLWTIHALENCIPLMTTQYLTWRVDLYLLAARAYENLGASLCFYCFFCHLP
jgi:hypothetical protein